MELPLSLLEMGCSGRFELTTRPRPGPPLAPLSTVGAVQETPGESSGFPLWLDPHSGPSQSQSLPKWKHQHVFYQL